MSTPTESDAAETPCRGTTKSLDKVFTCRLLDENKKLKATPTSQPALAWHRMTTRERDAAVALHIFPDRWPPKKLIKSKWVNEDGTPDGWGDWEAAPGCRGNWPLPAFTTAPQACAQVKAKFAYWMLTRAKEHEKGEFTANMFALGRYWGATASTEEEAVGIAALRACGITVETDL